MTGIYYPHVIFEEKFESYQCGQPYGEWVVGCLANNTDLGGSGEKFIYADVKSNKIVRYVFGAMLSKFYIWLKARLSYGSHYLGNYFALNMRLIYSGGKLLVRLEFNVAENKIYLKLINEDTNEVLYTYTYQHNLGDLLYGSLLKNSDYYYIDVIIYTDSGTRHLIIQLGDEKTQTCQLAEDTGIVIGSLGALELFPSTDAAEADALICVDDIHMESDVPVNIQLEYSIPQQVVNLVTAMMTLMLVIAIIGLMIQLLMRLIEIPIRVLE